MDGRKSQETADHYESSRERSPYQGKKRGRAHVSEKREFTCDPNEKPSMDPVKPPRNAARAFAIDPDDPTRGYVIGGGARGSSIQSTTNPYRHPKRLTKSSEHDLERSQAARMLF